MRVTRDRSTIALKLMFEFADASWELVIKLPLRDELLGLARERRFDAREFFRKLGN